MAREQFENHVILEPPPPPSPGTVQNDWRARSDE